MQRDLLLQVPRRFRASAANTPGSVRPRPARRRCHRSGGAGAGDFPADNGRIAFQREAVDCGPGCNTSEIFTVRADGTRLAQLTHNAPGLGCGNNGFCNGSPAWSPSGRRIAFNRESGPVVDDYVENVGIYVMNADGSHLRQVTQRARPSIGEDTDPQWSPDGRTMVFERTNVRAALPAGGIALWTVQLASGRERRITPFPLRGGDSPDWSPDGRRPETGGTNADVLVMDADATHVRNITRTERYDSYPDWGPAVR